MVISGPLNIEGCTNVSIDTSPCKGKEANLIHVVPNPYTIRALDPPEAFFFFTVFGRSSLEQLLPPTPARRIEEIYPRRTSCPAPTFVLRGAVGLLDQDVNILSFRVDGI